MIFQRKGLLCAHQEKCRYMNLVIDRAHFGGVLIFIFLMMGAFNGICFSEQVELKDRPMPHRYDRCDMCHMKKSHGSVPKVRQLKLEHDGISAFHGQREMSCNHCHDINHSNYLRSSAAFPASFKNSSPVCQRCHGEVYRDWKRGVHGKRTGGWKLPQRQYHCIDCHNPHSVKFQSMKALPSIHGDKHEP